MKFLFSGIVPFPDDRPQPQQAAASSWTRIPSDRLKSLLLPRIFDARAPNWVAQEETISSTIPRPQGDAPLPAVEVFLFFFLLFFFTDSEASASSLSSLKSPPLRSWGSTSRCGCSSAMISDLEIKWRISCWEPPVVRAEKCAGGRRANNEPLDNLCATTWPSRSHEKQKLYIHPPFILQGNLNFGTKCKRMDK